jgi:hypothetical protein
MRVCKSVLQVIGVLLFATAALAQPQQAIYGAETPQAAIAGLQRAVKANDVVAAIPFVSPAGRRELASEGISSLMMFLAFADPSDPMSGGQTLPKAERDAKRKAYRSAVDTVRKTLKPHGLDKVVGRPAMAVETQQAIDTAVARADTVVLVTSLISMMDRIGPMLGMRKSDRPTIPFTLGNVTNYRIDGDRATARAAGETLQFERIDDRWYVQPPAASRAR